FAYPSRPSLPAPPYTPPAPPPLPPLPLHAALPIWPVTARPDPSWSQPDPRSVPARLPTVQQHRRVPARGPGPAVRRSGTKRGSRSEEHTSELQSRENLVCRLLLEKKKNARGRADSR